MTGLSIGTSVDRAGCDLTDHHRRGHHPSTGCVLMADGGLKTGQLIGATDARAELPKARPLGPQNVLATLYHVLGIDPAQTFLTNTGRPMYVLDERVPVAEML